MIASLLCDISSGASKSAPILSRLVHSIHLLSASDCEELVSNVVAMISRTSEDRLTAIRILTQIVDTTPFSNVERGIQQSGIVDKFHIYLDKFQSTEEAEALTSLLTLLLQVDSDDIRSLWAKQMPKLISQGINLLIQVDVDRCRSGIQILKILSAHLGKSINISNGTAIIRRCIELLTHPVLYVEASELFAQLSVFDSVDFFTSNWNALTSDLSRSLHKLGIRSRAQKSEHSCKFSQLDTIDGKGGCVSALEIERVHRGCCTVLGEVRLNVTVLYCIYYYIYTYHLHACYYLSDVY
jgi:hypothetical protein